MPAVSEKPLVDNLEDVLSKIKTTTEPEELAALMLLASELYSQGQCVCDVKSEGTDDSLVCWSKINNERDRMLETFMTALRNLKKG